MKIIILTIIALIAFALNSILCRLALGSGEIDAAGYTVIRIVSGAVALWLIRASISKTKTVKRSGHWISAFFLFTYAACFSFAYLGLSAGSGALILFGSVQLTMVSAALVQGERPGAKEWLGMMIAAAGLVYLVSPGVTSPPLISSIMMAAAGASWGIYTLIGRSSSDPLAETAANFMRAVPFAAGIAVLFWQDLNLSITGTVYAVISGVFASGIGYAIWYTVLKHHSSTRAAVMQLSVPIIAAVGGVILLGESATLRLFIAAALILGGISIAITMRKHEPVKDSS